MSRPAGVIKAEAYNDVADWLTEMADDMRRRSEETTFSERTARAVLTADDVRKLAQQLRRRAKETEEQ